MPITVYKCEKCGAVYNDERDAEGCEREHFCFEVFTPENVDAECTFGWGEIYPSEIEIRKNGKLVALYTKVSV
jgi:hypothetical protein